MDIEELKKYLRNPDPVFRTDDDIAMAEAADVIESLQRELEEARRDADRLEWVVLHGGEVYIRKSRDEKRGWFAMNASNGLTFLAKDCESMRAAIDAARQQET